MMGALVCVAPEKSAVYSKSFVDIVQQKQKKIAYRIWLRNCHKTNIFTAYCSETVTVCGLLFIFVVQCDFCLSLHITERSQSLFCTFAIVIMQSVCKKLNRKKNNPLPAAHMVHLFHVLSTECIEAIRFHVFFSSENYLKLKPHTFFSLFRVYLNVIRV